MKRVLFVLGAALLLATSVTAVATAGGEYPPPDPIKVFVCKYVGTPGVDEVLQTGDNPIDVSVNAIPDYHGVGSYFADAQGRSFVLGPEHKASEHVDEPSVSECPGYQPPPTDVCPNIDGNQSEVPAGMHKDEAGNCVPDEQQPIHVTAGVTFTEATCTTPPAFHLVKTIPGIRFYNVEGPDFVDGHPVPGGTYTFTAIVDEGYVVDGPSVFVHTFAATPTDCGGTTMVTGVATVICDRGAQLYRLSGTIDGQVADMVTPPTFPGDTKGIVNVTVTRGDTSFRTTVTLNGDCTTTSTTPSTVVTTAVTVPTTTTPATTTPATKPAAKPKAKPVRKPVAKKKTTAVKKKAKINKKPKKAPKTL